MPAVMRSRVLMARASGLLDFVVAVFAKLQLQRTCRREPLARDPPAYHASLPPSPPGLLLSLRFWQNSPPHPFLLGEASEPIQFILRGSRRLLRSVHSWSLRQHATSCSASPVIAVTASTAGHPRTPASLQRAEGRVDEHPRRWMESPERR